MATKDRKSAKGALSPDKRSKKGDETTNQDLLKDESVLEVEPLSPMPDQSDLEEITAEVSLSEIIPPGPGKTGEPTEEPVYEEPILTRIIVESYEGEKDKGLYNGFGECSFTGGHSYKGQFVDGMMHGHGLYSWTDGLVYEGEFANNKVNGKGIYRWPDGSVYDGELLNGLRDGYGAFISKDEKSSYYGMWKNGKRNGKGRINYSSNGLSYYDGEWKDNIRHGFGIRQYPSQNIYQGMWFNNVRHGEGTMRWIDVDQMYDGQWQDGMQHGVGQHIWFMARMKSSQYALRNTYEGQFNFGLRSGYGVFYYANGARYEGYWANNMKHGSGKFIFKNGRVYEGIFEKDHIVEFPGFTMDSVSTPDLTQIRTRTPLPSEQMSIASNESRNTYGPSFQLDVELLLQAFIEVDREEEASQVIFVIMRFMTNLRKIYAYYSQLGYEGSPDNTFVMSQMQFWRFLKDCRLHHTEISLAEMDRALDLPYQKKSELHCPYNKILFREFLNYLVTLAWKLYHQEEECTTPVLSWCMSKLITENVLQYACNVQGYIFTETRRAVNAMIHMDQAYDVYKSWSTPRKLAPNESILKMRQFLFLMKDFKLVNVDLTPKEIIRVLAEDDPNVTDEDGAINLELEMTFLEFFEALVGCAQVYVTEAVVKDPNTPRPSTMMTQGETIVSMSGSAVSKHSDGEEEDDDGGTPANAITSEAASPQLHRASSSTTHKVQDMSKTYETQQSLTAVSGASVGGIKSVDLNSKQKFGAIVTDLKKTASFISSHSDVVTEGDPVMVQSIISMVEQSETEEEEQYDDLGEIEELDEATRQFNFWTHQLHIFFVRKFFPAAHRWLILRKLMHKREQEHIIETQIEVREEIPSSNHSDIPGHLPAGDTGELAQIVEQPEAEITAA